MKLNFFQKWHLRFKVRGLYLTLKCCSNKEVALIRYMASFLLVLVQSDVPEVKELFNQPDSQDTAVIFMFYKFVYKKQYIEIKRLQHLLKQKWYQQIKKEDGMTSHEARIFGMNVLLVYLGRYLYPKIWPLTRNIKKELMRGELDLDSAYQVVKAECQIGASILKKESTDESILNSAKDISAILPEMF